MNWIGAKMQKQADGGRKNRSGHAQEHAAANLDNTKFISTPKLEAEPPSEPTASPDVSKM